MLLSLVMELFLCSLRNGYDESFDMYQMIACASRVLNSSESKYSVTHLETLTVVWSLKYFRDIIYGYLITISTDLTAVTQLFKGSDLTGRLLASTIQQFNSIIEYLPGKANTAVDALSRSISFATLDQIPNFPPSELSTAQRQDTLWSSVVYALESVDHSTLLRVPVPISEFILRDAPCRTMTVDKERTTQLVIPRALVEAVLQLIHRTPQAGHPGRDRTLAAACTRYYWPTMRLDIERHIAQCLSCAQTKGTTKTAPILDYSLPAGPIDTVAIDFLQLPHSRQGSTYALVRVDLFSRFVILTPLPNKSAPVVAHAIVSHLIRPFTTPRVLLSDNGTKFKNAVLASICDQYNIKQNFITAHHLAFNGLVERTNRKVLDILFLFTGKFTNTWEDWLPHVATSINSSLNSFTVRAPYFIFLWV